MQESIEFMRGLFESSWQQVSFFIMRVLGALLVLLVGLFLARSLRKIVVKGLSLARVDEFSEKVKLNEVLTRVGFGKSLTYVVGFVAFWFVILMTLAGVASILHLDPLTSQFMTFVNYLPRLMMGVLILVGGFVISHFLGEVVLNAATANQVKGAGILARITKVVVVTYASIMALGQLGLETAILKSSVNIILGSIGLALAISFGLGGRDVAAELIRGFLKEKKS